MNCSKCSNDCDGFWLGWKGKNYCSDCYLAMKDAPRMKPCLTPEDLLK